MRGCVGGVVVTAYVLVAGAVVLYVALTHPEAAVTTTVIAAGIGLVVGFVAARWDRG